MHKRREKKLVSHGKGICSGICLALMLAGCSENHHSLPADPPVNIQAQEENVETEEMLSEEILQTQESSADAGAGQEESMETVIEETDWSDYFGGRNGTAVIYDPTESRYQICNQELALTRRSPCSTFKIISSLIALEYGVIEPDDSVRKWSGETFWMEDWNRDIDFSDAFRASCVWYFREVTDEIGKERMQEELNRLSYGNCDISDWSGLLNTNNSNPPLTGFWIESSLLISPKEQTEVMERIFGDHTIYKEETESQLEQVMRLPDQEETEITVYGKTGMGKAGGVVVDVWFTGFADAADRRVYFCVYFGESGAQEISSAGARETAVEIVSGYLSGESFRLSLPGHNKATIDKFVI